MKTLLGPDGNPIHSGGGGSMDARAEVLKLRRQIMNLRAKYDAAQTSVHNEHHWANADNLDPHAANSYMVRRKLRSRSRYEVIENNPYLKGTILTVANDFVGSGPKLKITDPRIDDKRRQWIETRFQAWAKLIKLRHKLWRLRLAKLVDGEAFMVAYLDPDPRNPIGLNFQVVEADRVSSETFAPAKDPKNKPTVNEVDGVRFDRWENPLEYFILSVHPGASSFLTAFATQFSGEWISSRWVIHWFRQDRGWLRGIPETTPSLPLCALLRRYTLAVVRSAEVVANFSAVLETEGPPGIAAWTDGQGNIVSDDPFDVFPIEMGLITKLPWGHKLSQLKAEQPTTVYDAFVNALLREIIRPLLVPFNVASGSSKDSNMASAVVDAHIYKAGQEAERFHAEDHVLAKVFQLFWEFAVNVDNYLDAPNIPQADFLRSNPTLYSTLPDYSWGWDQVGIEHTDPSKIAQAISTLHQGGFITDRDIQEGRFNRDVDQWREEIRKDIEFRNEVGLPVGPSTGSSPKESGADAPDDNSEK